MGQLEYSDQTRYDISDLGYLDPKPDPSLDSILRLSAASLTVPVSYVAFADDVRNRLCPKSVRGGMALEEMAMTQTLAAEVRDAQRIIAHSGGDDATGGPWTDIDALNVHSALGAPIFGPAGEPVGAIIVADHMARRWTVSEERVLRDLADLVSQQILLKAALMTLKLVVRRGPIASVHDFPN